MLKVEEDELDLLRFRAFVEAGGLSVEAGDLPGGADNLRQAIRLFRAPAFPDLVDLELLRADLDELEEQRLDAYQDLIDVELALGRHDELVAELQLLVTQQPYRERLWASLVLALYRSDRQGEALAACRRARRVFLDDLGIDPGPHLKKLERAVLQQDPSLAAPVADGHRRTKHRLDNLPAELTPLIGRDAELDALRSLYEVEACRLVTITGPGGTGKTRLALAAAKHMGPKMADGVCWVSLAPLTQAQQVPAAIAAALGLEEWAGSDPMQASRRFLRSHRILMAMDNFEHLEEAWPTVQDLLTAAPGLRLLATSRRPLGLRAEYEYELAPLALPPLDPPLPLHELEKVPAVQLFATRARAVRPLFRLGSNNAMVVARISRLVDGLPLAIELAAAQLRYRDEQTLLADLEVSLTALPAAFRDLPQRQRTLAATIDWSYQLLDESARQLFTQLGVFAGDPTVKAVDSICRSAGEGEAATADLLAVLEHHSLLRRYTDSAGERRVSMLHSIREFARDRLTLDGGSRVIQYRHAEFFLAVAEAASPQLWGQDQAETFQLLHADAPDLRAALAWAAGPYGSSNLALRLVGHLWRYWELTGDVAVECEIALNLVNNAPDAPAALQGPALSGTATLCWLLGRHDEAADLHERSRQAFLAAGNSQGVAWATMCLATQAAEQDDAVTARHLAEEALSLPEASPHTRVACLITLSLLAFYSGDLARSLDLCRECVELARPLGDNALLANTLLNLADGMQKAGNYDEAEGLLYEATERALELGGQGHLVAFVESLAAVNLEQRRTGQAIRLLAAADAHRTEFAVPLFAAEQRRIESLITKARSEAGPVTFGLEWAAGQALTLRQILREVLHNKQERKPETRADQSVPAAGSRNAAPWS
ncbi:MULTISPECIES: BTAD domain-containing putative transcriptional regulator [unclassified Arthrobacter]|uniref:ATP-binding protein n=1 Tax=unclassified Arthrobacter TaxID=235627 RepID=UPI0027E2E5D4|nr:BTAD domain-containing putative transcriptional regulator [Arthrobacter sp. MAHUQ-56]